MRVSDLITVLQDCPPDYYITTLSPPENDSTPATEMDAQVVMRNDELEDIRIGANCERYYDAHVIYKDKKGE